MTDPGESFSWLDSEPLSELVHYFQIFCMFRFKKHKHSFLVQNSCFAQNEVKEDFWAQNQHFWIFI